MMTAREVPLFLWEQAIEYAAYVREHAITHALPGMTPYEAWHSKKLSVAHLREFGSPVYVLRQGQSELSKLLPKSEQFLFVGFEEGSKSIKYYNPKMRKVLTSCNYQFLDKLPQRETSPEPIVIPPPPAISREGEWETSMLQTGGQRNKRPVEGQDEPNNENENPRKLHNKAPVNYRYLDNPFPDEEGKEIQVSTLDIYQVTLGSPDPSTVREARTFDDWPEWEKAIRAELDQLNVSHDFGKDDAMIILNWVSVILKSSSSSTFKCSRCFFKCMRCSRMSSW
jgi:hypothetical protein